MINREALLQHIKEDLQLRQDMTKILDRAEAVLKKHEVRTTDFLTPAQVRYAKDILAGINDIRFTVTGGYPEAERSLIYIYPDYMEISFIDPMITALEIVGNGQFQHITHRDYMGAILGLGLKREKIGDIILQKSDSSKFQACQVVVHTDIKDYILYNLEKIGSMRVTVKEIALEDLKGLQTDYKEITGNVASLRLDAVIAMACRISRGDAQSLIEREYVSLNWEIINRGSYEVQEKDVISVRGKGRVYIDSIKGLTKSGRITLQIKIPL